MAVLAWILIALGAAGVLLSAVRFVRVTMPGNYGTNPGFGAFESMAAPWLLLACVGLGLRTGSLRPALLGLFLGFVGLAVLALVLGAAFGRRS